jgi:hypothetical protein
MIVVTPAGPVDLGTVEATPTIGIIDRSRRVTNDFGVTSVVERGFARRMSVRLAVPSDAVDALQRTLADLRATVATWIADARFQSLTVRGFYKDFSIDMPGAAISYCTLTVEGLTVTEPITDTGADPAPEGKASTLRLLDPIRMTDATLFDASVPESDHPEWAAGTGYGKGARVIKAATHRVYESAADANVGNDPMGDSGKWLDIGPTNRWAAFDQALGTATTSSDHVIYTIDGQIGAVALLDVSADAVRVQGDANDYDRTQPGASGAITFLDLPAGTTRVTVTLTGGQVAVGTLLVGRLVGLGVTEASPTAGITDYSRKDTNDFGDTSVVERAWAKRMSARSLLRTDAIDDVVARLATVRARPVLWLGREGQDSLTVYGFFKDFSIEAGQTVSKLSLTIEGLSKAAPLPKPITSVVAQGSADGINWHLGLQPGDVFLRISNDSGRTYGEAVRVAGRDGTNAFTAYLTNSDHTVPATFDGTVTSYAGAESIFVIGLGGHDLTDSGQFDLSVASNPQNLSVIITGRHFRVTGGLDAGEDSAALKMRLTGTGQFAGVVVDQVFSLGKSKGGRNGEAPALIRLTASALTARYDTNGVLVPGQAITFAAKRQNTTTRTVFTLRNSAGDAVHGPYEPGEFARLGGTTFWSAFDPDTLTLTEAGIVAVIRDHGGVTGRVTMVASIEGTALNDAVSLTKVRDGVRGNDGTSPYNAILSNEMHTVPADAAGNVLSYDGATFTLMVFYGSQDVTSSFALEGSDNPQSLTVPGEYPTYRVSGGFDAAEPSASLTMYFLGKAGTPHAGIRLAKVFSLAKSIGGAGGAPAALISLSASALTARYDTTGALVPGQAITFGARRQNTSARTLFTLRNSAGNAVLGPRDAATFADAGGTAFWSAYDPDTITLTEAGIIAVIRDHGGATGRVTMIASIEGTALTDAVSLQKVQDGARGADGTSPYNAILSNETHTVPADKDGNVTSYAGAEFTVTVFYGSTDVTGSFDLETSDNPQGLAGPYAYPRFTITSGFDASEPAASVTYRFIGKPGTPHAGIRLTKVFSLAKSKDGSRGADGINPPLVSATATPQAISYNKDNVISSGPVTFKANLTNAIGPVVWTAIGGVHALYNFPGVDFSDGGATMTLTAGRMNQILEYNEAHGSASQAFMASASGTSDTVTVTKIRDGAQGADVETYTIGSRGNSAPAPTGYLHGLRRSDGLVFADSIDTTALRSDQYRRSYTLCWRISRDYWAVRHFDVWGAGEQRYPDDQQGTAAGMAVHLNSLPAGTPIVVFTGDEPQQRRKEGGLPDALYRCGASPAFIDDAKLRRRGAYVLIGVAGWGTGRGFEYFAGSTDDAADAIVQANFSIVNGVPSAATAGAKGADGFSLIASPPAFVVPSFSNGTSKPAWQGGSCRIALIKGGAEIAADAYSYVAVSNISSIAMSGQNVTFADVIGDRGEFTARATRGGISYDLRVTVVRTKDGSSAFKSEQDFSSFTSSATGTGNTTVPGGKSATVSAGVQYLARRDDAARGRVSLYWRNVTDSGPSNFLGSVDGSISTNYNRGTPTEQDYDQVFGSVSASFSFTTPTPDKQIEYSAIFGSANNAGNIERVIGKVQLEVQ